MTTRTWVGTRSSLPFMKAKTTTWVPFERQTAPVKPQGYHNFYTWCRKAWFSCWSSLKKKNASRTYCDANSQTPKKQSMSSCSRSKLLLDLSRRVTPPKTKRSNRWTRIANCCIIPFSKGISIDMRTFSSFFRSLLLHHLLAAAHLGESHGRLCDVGGEKNVANLRWWGKSKANCLINPHTIQTKPHHGLKHYTVCCCSQTIIGDIFWCISAHHLGLSFKFNRNVIHCCWSVVLACWFNATASKQFDTSVLKRYDDVVNFLKWPWECVLQETQESCKNRTKHLL